MLAPGPPEPMPAVDSAQIRSIAVLPLESISGDPEQEYFAEGMTEALITSLAKVEALRVISRTSVMQYKRARKPLPEIARELALVYAALGDDVAAFEWFERAYEERSQMLVLVPALRGPTYPLRSDPRFVDLMHRVGLPG